MSNPDIIKVPGEDNDIALFEGNVVVEPDGRVILDGAQQNVYFRYSKARARLELVIDGTIHTFPLS